MCDFVCVRVCFLQHIYTLHFSSPEPEPGVRYEGGINVTTKASRTNSIKIVLQRDNPDEDYNIR